LAAGSQERQTLKRSC